jgi:hypothetical protein
VPWRQILYGIEGRAVVFSAIARHDGEFAGRITNIANG